MLGSNENNVGQPAVPETFLDSHTYTGYWAFLQPPSLCWWPGIPVWGGRGPAACSQNPSYHLSGKPHDVPAGQRATESRTGLHLRSLLWLMNWRERMEGEQSKATRYRGHSSSSLICQLLALDAVERLWNICFQLRLQPRKKPTYWQAHHPLWPDHWASRFSRLHWIVSEMEFSISLSTLNLPKKQQRRKNHYFLLWTYFLARKCSKGTHVIYRNEKLGINRLMAARTWVGLLTLLLNSFLSSSAVLWIRFCVLYWSVLGLANPVVSLYAFSFLSAT